MTNESTFELADAHSYDSLVGLFEHYSQKYTAQLPPAMLSLHRPSEIARVLDIGTGTGIVALHLAEHLHTGSTITGIDLSEEMLDTARKKFALINENKCSVNFVTMDAQQLNFQNNSFDAIYSLYALRHFPNPEKALSEMIRVLNPGGIAVVAVGSRPPVFSIDGACAATRKVRSYIYQMFGKELQACNYLDSLIHKYCKPGAGDEITEWSKKHQSFTVSLSDLMKNAGFSQLKLKWQGQWSEIESVDDFYDLQMTFSSFARKRIGSADPATISAIKTEFAEKCDKVLQNNGSLIYQSGALIVSGIKE